MFSDFAQFFLPEYEFFLDEINYRRLPVSANGETNLTCQDTLSANIVGDGIKVLVVRRLHTDTDELFDLSVSFGAILKFNKDKASEIQWEKIDLAKEFKESGQFVLGNLLSRICLLIAQITSSFGQMPLILPPMIPEGSSLPEKIS